MIDIKTLIKISPAWFAFITSHGKWQPAKHLLALESRLLDTLSSKKKRIIINMPPRHGKSEFISKYFAAWYLAVHPNHKIILTSYEAGFAQMWGRKIMQLIKEFGNRYFNIELDKNKSAASEFCILGKEGTVYTVGAGGAITGKGADLLIIDDPIKNDAEANSLTYRNNIYEWFRSTALTRLEPNGTVIIIMTRWHDDDLTGRILRDTPNDWEVFSIPAIAEENDILKRKVGRALWEKRFNIEKLNEIKSAIGSYWFSALYQQRPSAIEGGIFKRMSFKFFDTENDYFIIDKVDGKDYIRKNDCIYFAAIDLAATISERSDFTVAAIGVTTHDGKLLILEIIREKIEGADHLKFLENIYNEYKPSVIGVESVQYQISLIQAAQRAGLPVKPLKADKDKLSRAITAAAKIESGNVYFKRNAMWFEELMNEALLFPAGKHDDQIDALGYLIELTRNYGNNFLPQSSNFKKIIRKDMEII